MHVRSRTQQTVTRTRTELLMLLIASVACATVLTLGIVNGGDGGIITPGLSQLAMIAFVAGAGVLAAVLTWRSLRRARRAMHAAQEETGELRRRLAVSEAIIGAEPQTLIFWDHSGKLEVVSHTLRGIAGMPENSGDLLQFSEWLDQRTAAKLKTALAELLRDGRSFNTILKTGKGGHLEADGRAAGGRAVIRLRDIAGYKREISRIIDEHRNLARDIKASRILLDSLPVPVWLADRGGRKTWVNSAYVRAVEATRPEEVLDREIDLLDQRQRRAVGQSLAEHGRFEKRLSLITGSEKRAHDVIVRGFEDGFAGAAIDVAALESAKGELDRQLAAFDRTLDKVATAVAIFNRQRRLVFFNEAYRKLWGLEPAWLNTRPRDQEVIDRLRAQSLLPEVVNYPEWRNELLSANEKGDEQEHWWHLPDSRILHVIVEQRPDGGVTHLYVDETERLALETRFNALNRVQGETIDSLKEGVAVFATDGRLKLHNSAFASIWRLDEDELQAEPHFDVIAEKIGQHFQDVSAWQQLKPVVTAFSDTRAPIEGQIVRDDETVIDYSTTPLPDGATLLTFADVTASKQYERALVERNDALEASDRLKNQFIGHVSYELRTPLTNIIGFSEMLDSALVGPLNEKQREYLGDISTSSETLLAIIDDILDLATIDAGALELAIEEVDVRDLIKAAILGIRERAIRSKLTLDVAIADDVATMFADERRVRQVLYNLLSNAIGFSHEGGEVFVNCWRDRDTMVFQVQDNGIGIPESEQEKIFRRFESNSQGSNHRGAGLGLSLVKSLVDLHGGSMTLESRPGAGTRVTVNLPRDARGMKPIGVPVAAQPAIRALEHQRAGEGGSQPALAHKLG